MTERAVSNLLKKLNRYTPRQAEEALQESIANSYKGVFPKADNKQGKTPANEPTQWKPDDW